MPHPCAIATEGHPAFESCQKLAEQYKEELITAGTSLKEQAVEVAAEMKEPLKQVALDFVQALRTGTNFVLEQMPILFQEIIKWSIAEDFLYILLGALMVSFGLWMWRFTARHWEAWGNERGNDGLKETGAAVATAAFLLTGFTVVFCNALDATKAFLAPRLYLVEYFANLAKGTGSN